IRGSRPYGLPLRPPIRGLKVPMDPAGLPTRLSQTGLFRSLESLEPAPGLIPYAVNSPLWSDGAAKRRWIALPGGARITYRPTGRDPRTQVWPYPSRDECLKCHTTSAGFVLGPKTRQLNGTFPYPDPAGIADNQLRVWSYLGMFELGQSPAFREEDIPRLARL